MVFILARVFYAVIIGHASIFECSRVFIGCSYKLLPSYSLGCSFLRVPRVWSRGVYPKGIGRIEPYLGIEPSYPKGIDPCLGLALVVYLVGYSLCA